MKYSITSKTTSPQKCQVTFNYTIMLMHGNKSDTPKMVMIQETHFEFLKYFDPIHSQVYQNSQHKTE